MTTNQTIDGVPRELLERCARELSIGIGPAPKNRAQELRALLDSTDLQCSVPAIDTSALGNKAAAQPQGEPVAWRYHDDAGSSPWFNGAPEQVNLEFAERRGGRIERSFAEQPDPVAVTLQQVLSAYEYAESHPHKYLRGTTNWCAAVAWSLSGKRPAHANPPPGTEPSGTHHDNDGLDEWRKS